MGNLQPQRHNPTLRASAESDRERLARRSREARDSVAEIGSIPPIADPRRREAARKSLRFFLREYFPNSTGLSPLSEEQLACVDRIEVALQHETWVANIMPRGFIKSTLSENACLWAMLFGLQPYILFFAGTGPLAEKGVHSIKTELLANELLLADFPEACMPFIALQGKSQRCATQTYQGQLTNLVCTKDTLRLGMIPGFAGSGSIFESYGLLAPPRGARYKDEQGRNVRPGFSILDDPQTDDSATSYPQTQKRLHYIRNSISMMGGHADGMSMVMNATIVAEGDLVDRISNGKTEESQSWLANKVAMLKSLPTHLQDEWLGEYSKIRRTYDRSDPMGQVKAKLAATEYYRQHRDKMDAGAKATWENIGLKKDEISAIQHALNIWIDKGEATFWAECQNAPLRPSVAAPLYLEADELVQRVNNYAPGKIPTDRGQVVFFVDVHDEVLYWTVAAVGMDFSGDVLSYGTFPEQNTQWFTLRSAKQTLSQYYPDKTPEQAIEQGVIDCISRLLAGNWAFSDGKSLPVSLGLVDAGYKPKIVARAIRSLGCGDRVMTSRGIPSGPRSKPMPEYDLSPKRCLRAGPNLQDVRWFYPREHVDGNVLRLHFDANYWKSVMATALGQTADTGAWKFYGTQQTDHGHYVSHLVAERPAQLTAEGRTVNVWEVVGNKDNHWWDTIVGCGVAASVMGCQLPADLHEHMAARITLDATTQVQNNVISNASLRPDGRPFFITARDDL